MRKYWMFVFYGIFALLLAIPLFFMGKLTFLRDIFDLFCFRFQLLPFSAVAALFTVTFLVDFFLDGNDNQARENYLRIESMLGSRNNVLMIGLISLLSGSTEELFFRGYLLYFLIYVLPLPSILGIAVVSVIFGLLHINQGKIVFVLSALISGVLCYYVIAVRSLIIPIIFHVGFNFIQLCFVLPRQRNKFSS